MSRSASVELALHRLHAVLHHSGDRRRQLVGQKVRDPDEAAALAFGEDLDRAVMVTRTPFDHRPDEAARLVVHIDDQFLRGHPVGEGDDAGIALEPGIGHEIRREARVDRTDVAHRIPYGLQARAQRHFLADRSHDDLLVGDRIYESAASRSWKILRSPLAARRKPRGEVPAARWNVRTKLERSAKPTSSAMSVMARSSSASRRAARRRRERIRY